MLDPIANRELQLKSLLQLDVHQFEGLLMLIPGCQAPGFLSVGEKGSSMEPVTVSDPRDVQTSLGRLPATGAVTVASLGVRESHQLGKLIEAYRAVRCRTIVADQGPLRGRRRTVAHGGARAIDARWSRTRAIVLYSAGMSTFPDAAGCHRSASQVVGRPN